MRNITREQDGVGENDAVEVGCAVDVSVFVGIVIAVCVKPDLKLAMAAV